MNMAFLSSFRAGQETLYRTPCAPGCATFPCCQDLGDAALKRVLAEANWFGLPGGSELARDGENAQALFLVVTGSLGVFVEDADSKKRRLVAMSARETVGEMSLISGQKEHSAELVALRDTELLRISPQGFESLITRIRV